MAFNKDFPAASGAKLKVVKKPFNSSASDAYRGPNRGTSQRKPTQSGMPKATNTETIGNPGPSYPNPPLSSNKAPKASATPAAPATAAPAGSTSDSTYTKGSTKPVAYQAPVAGVKRGGVESRYNRDGLAMDRRK